MPPPSGSCEREVKVVVVGPYCSGKTSLLRRYINGAFELSRSTVGVDFFRINPKRGRDRAVLVWDTAGQERFMGVTPSYLRDSNAALVVFDVSCIESWNAVPHWIGVVRQHSGADTPILVVGNKTDLEDSRAHTHSTFETGALSQGCGYLEASAKTGAGVNRVFDSIAAVGDEIRDQEQAKEIDLVLRDARERRPYACCQ